LLLLIPFLTVREVVDKRDYRKICSQENVKSCFAVINSGPFETVGSPCQAPDKKHILGCDDIGRDVAARLIYGARASLATGVFSSLIALFIGCSVGLAAGFKRGVFDLITMRFVEILLCFPSFLLLLILMSLLGDRQLGQSIPLVIAVLGFTGWIGIAFLVRGETLKQRNLPYIESCIVSGIPETRIMFFHLLPNVVFPVLIAFTFGIAGSILAESSLSFLGFGVKAPAPSWGGLLRQAFDNPLDHWHLTVFPGAALFIAVMSFNFVGEGLRKALSVKE
jgi:ABC-type dipeptide/oligopeptide/nickel transport system permease subunit